mgnify:CR=1 FL=1
MPTKVKEIQKNGWWASQRKARQECRCISCHELIMAGDTYWSIYKGASGLTGRIHPAKVCPVCQPAWMERT